MLEMVFPDKFVNQMFATENILSQGIKYAASLANDDLNQVEAHIAQENSIVVAIDIVLKIIDTTEMMLSNHSQLNT
jgi:hypothetical protein